MASGLSSPMSLGITRPADHRRDALALLTGQASAIADERRRGMLAALFLAGIGPAGLVWSKLKGALYARPSRSPRWP